MSAASLTSHYRDGAVAVPCPSAGASRVAMAALCDLRDVPLAAWRELAANAIEPNAFYDPHWALAVSASARGRMNAKALCAWSVTPQPRLIGVMPVVSARRALGLPLPVFVSWQGYAPLGTPLLARDAADEAARGLLDAARQGGAHGLLLQHVPSDGAAFAALTRASDDSGHAPRILATHARALLDATDQNPEFLRDALGAKKLKELRRQHHRLTDLGPLTFDIASDPACVTRALEEFLALEARGWKGQRGTALAAHEGDARFLRHAAPALAERGQLFVVTLRSNGEAIANGLVLKHLDRAFFFKVAFDESLSRCSPGMQLTLELTKHLCAQAGIDSCDSTADADHPMIDHVWRGRLPLAETYLPLRASLPAALAPHLITARSRIRAPLRQFASKLRAFREKQK